MYRYTRNPHKSCMLLSQGYSPCSPKDHQLLWKRLVSLIGKCKWAQPYRDIYTYTSMFTHIYMYINTLTHALMYTHTHTNIYNHGKRQQLPPCWPEESSKLRHDSLMLYADGSSVLALTPGWERCLDLIFLSPGTAGGCFLSHLWPCQSLYLLDCPQSGSQCLQKIVTWNFMIFSSIWSALQ